jgi:hypothetical protein
VAFTCPVCSRTSYHPTDERFGYCAACDKFTGPTKGMVKCPEPRCGTDVPVVRALGARFGGHGPLADGNDCPMSGQLIPGV